MKNIKTTTCIMVLFVLLITGKSCLAEKINVYDGNFCDMYNFIVQSQFMGSDSEKNLISIKEERMKILTTGGMLLHCYPLNNVVNGNGTFIVCHIGNNGGVCQIDIVNNMMATKEDARNAYVAILKVLDVSDQDIEFLLIYMNLNINVYLMNEY